MSLVNECSKSLEILKLYIDPLKTNGAYMIHLSNNDSNCSSIVSLIMKQADDSFKENVKQLPSEKAASIEDRMARLTEYLSRISDKDKN